MGHPVNDGPRLALIEKLIDENPDWSQSRAIMQVDPNGGNKRRLEQKLKKNREARLGDVKSAILAAHVARFPTFRSSDPTGVRFVAVAPAGFAATDGTSDRPVAVTVAFDLRVQRIGQGFVGNVTPIPEGDETPLASLATTATPYHVFAAADLLGLLDGSNATTSLLADALGRLLHAEWVAAKLAEPDDLAQAVASEAARLREEGLDEILEMLSEDARKVAVAYRDRARRETLSRVVAPGFDPSRLGLMLSLASFAHHAIADLEEDEVESWFGRPLECLVAHLNDKVKVTTLGRPFDMVDAGWVHGLFGDMDVPPLTVPAIETLVRWQAYVDPARAKSLADAKGLLALVDALLEIDTYRCDGSRLSDAVRLLFERMDRGPDAASGYGDVADALRSAGERLPEDRYGDLSPLARGVVALTFGVEYVCGRLAVDLIVPTVAMACVATVAKDTPRTGRKLLAIVARDGWDWRFERQAREMVVDGRRVADLVDATALTGWGYDRKAERNRLEGRVLADAVREWSSPTRSIREVDMAWDVYLPLMAPRHRVRGRDGLDDQFGGLVRQVGRKAFNEDVIGYVAQLRRAVRRAFVNRRRRPW